MDFLRKILESDINSDEVKAKITKDIETLLIKTFEEVKGGVEIEVDVISEDDTVITIYSEYYDMAYNINLNWAKGTCTIQDHSLNADEGHDITDAESTTFDPFDLFSVPSFIKVKLLNFLMKRFGQDSNKIKKFFDGVDMRSEFQGIAPSGETINRADVLTTLADKAQDERKPETAGELASNLSIPQATLVRNIIPRLQQIVSELVSAGQDVSKEKIVRKLHINNQDREAYKFVVALDDATIKGLIDSVKK
jgi:hypothetical protein